MAGTNAPVNIPNPFVTNPAQALAQGRFAPVRPTEEYSGHCASFSGLTDNFANLSQWTVNVGGSVSGNCATVNPGGYIWTGNISRSLIGSSISFFVNQIGGGFRIGASSAATNASATLFVGPAYGFSPSVTSDANVTLYNPSIPYLSGVMNWVRIREDDGTLSWDYSSDGINWVTPFTYNYAGLIGLNGPTSAQFFNQGTTPVTISRFNLPPPAPAMPGSLAPYTPSRTPVIPGLSIAARKLFGPRGLPVIAQTPHAPYGSTSGGYSFISTAIGSENPTGSGSGGYGFASAATGRRAPIGVASGSFGCHPLTVGPRPTAAPRQARSHGHRRPRGAPPDPAPRRRASAGRATPPDHAPRSVMHRARSRGQAPLRDTEHPRPPAQAATGGRPAPTAPRRSSPSRAPGPAPTSGPRRRRDFGTQPAGPHRATTGQPQRPGAESRWPSPPRATTSGPRRRQALDRR